MTGTPIGDEVADFMRTITHAHLFHHHAPPQPAAPAPPAIPHNDSNQEDTTMSTLLAEIKGDFATVTAKLEHLDEEAVAKAEAIKATPEGAEAFDLLHAFATSAGAGPVLGVIGGILKSVAALPAAAPESALQPAATGPYVAGQA